MLLLGYTDRFGASGDGVEDHKKTNDDTGPVDIPAPAKQKKLEEGEVKKKSFKSESPTKNDDGSNTPW